MPALSPYPDHFYYQARDKAGVEYVSQNRGIRYHIPRLLNGQPYWPNPAPDIERKKKKLILGDWTAKAWSNNMVSKIQEALAKAMDEDFEIYIWQEGTIQRLSKENLHLLEDNKIRRAIIPEFPEKIIAACQQEFPELIADNTRVMDDYDLQWMLEGKAPSERTMPAHALHPNSEGGNANLYRQQIKKKLIERAKPTITSTQGRPPIEFSHLLRDGDYRDYDYGDEPSFHGYISNLKHNVREPNSYRYLALAAHEQQLTEEETHGLPHYPNLQSLTLYHMHSVQDVNHLLAQPKLKYLTLGKDFKLRKAADGLTESNIESLTIDSDKLDIETLNQLLARLPRLRSFTIKDCPKPQDDYLSKINLPSSIREFSLVTNFSNQTVRHMLRKIPQ